MTENSVMENLNEEILCFLDGLTLQQLYKLIRLCLDTIDQINLMGFWFKDNPPSLNDVREYVTPLLSEFPSINSIISLSEFAAEIVRVYSKKETEKLQRELDQESDISKRLHNNEHLFSRRSPKKKIITSKLSKITAEAHKFIETGSWGCVEKADAYIEYYIGSNCETFAQQEAIIYMRSRSRDCREQILDIIKDWHRAANARINEFARGKEIISLEEERKNESFGVLSIEEARDIGRWSLTTLRNFWGGHDDEELIIDATMLRTVEWCEIGGFDIWWQRWADNVTDNIARGLVQIQVSCAVWLFSLCRSDYAISLLDVSCFRDLK